MKFIHWKRKEGWKKTIMRMKSKNVNVVNEICQSKGRWNGKTLWRRSNSKWSIAWRSSSNQCNEPSGCIGWGHSWVELAHKWRAFPACVYRQLCKTLSSKPDARYCINGQSRKGIPHAFDFDRCYKKNV